MPVPRFASAGLLLLLALVGCIEHPLRPEESAAIESRQSALVLLRFAGTDQNGDRLEPFTAWDGDFLRIAIGDFDSGGVPQGRKVRTLNPAARDEGWIALVLSPGYYYLVFGKNLGANTPLHADSLPRWRIEVPPGAAVIYAGTFRLKATTGYVLLVGRRILSFDQEATTIEDERETALETAGRDLPSLPPPVARLAVRHSGPILLGLPPARASE